MQRSYTVVVTFLLGLSVSQTARGEPPQLANLTAAQRADGSGIVDIRYDAYDADSARLWVGVAISKNGGAWFGVTPCSTALEGDFGERITPGAGKHIVWHPQRTLPGVAGASFVVRLTASDWPTATNGRSPVFGTYLYCRVHAGLPSFLDGTVYPIPDSRNLPHLQMYWPIGPDGEPVPRVAKEQLARRGRELLRVQPDGATREWWTHMLRQIVDAELDFVLYSSFGQLSLHDADCSDVSVLNPFQPAFAGRAFGRIFDEMGFPLKVAFFLDVPGSWTAYNCDRMREHYGAGKWSKYKWLDNGKDPDHIIDCMPVTRENVKTYMYDLIMRPFFMNFNRPEDRARWQTHNDLPLDQGGRPVVHIYAAGPQWFKDFDGAGPAFRYLKELFQKDFGVEPFLAVDNLWFKHLSGDSLAQLEAVADAKQSYLGNWLFGSKHPPDANSWEFKNYRITRLCPGLKGPAGRWWQYPDQIMGKRWIYIDRSQGPTETWFFDRDWQLGMNATGFTRAPDQVLVGHWDEYTEGEMIGLMADYERNCGGTLPPDFYLKHVAQCIRDYRAHHPSARTTIDSASFALTTDLPPQSFRHPEPR